jgi:hypothetical protein
MTISHLETKQLTPAEQRELNTPHITGPTYYTAHGGPPTNAMEWKAQNFGAGRMYGGHVIPLDELEKDWPEIFNNPDCMRGYRKGLADAQAKGWF